MSNVILASGSPRRKELLEQIGLEFEVVTCETDEECAQKDPGMYVKELSFSKAMAVYNLLVKQNMIKDKVVLGADTIVYHNGNVLLKPKDREDAYRIIKSLSGETHQVYTGVSIVSEYKTESFYEKTNVSIYEMSDEEIWKYIDSGEPMDKAGAYGIQGLFAAYVKEISGDYNNVVGLPVARVYHELKKFVKNED